MLIPVHLSTLAQVMRHGDDASAKALMVRVMEEAHPYLKGPAPAGFLWTLTEEGVGLRPLGDPLVMEVHEEAEATQAEGAEPIVLLLRCSCGGRHPCLGMRVELVAEPGRMQPSTGGPPC